MTITFNELRRIKDQLPSGSTQRIADELGVDVEIVRNYFGGRHFESGNTVGVHFEPGPTAASSHWTIRPYSTAQSASSTSGRRTDAAGFEENTVRSR